MNKMDSLPERVLGRKITGMSAILLPMESESSPDWKAFRTHVERTLAAGLVPAINMDTGFGNLLNDQERQRALDVAKDCCGGRDFVGGVFVGDEPGAAFDFDSYRHGIDQVIDAGGTPIIFQSFGLTEQSDEKIVSSYEAIGEHVGPFLAFELGQVFAPFGKIYSLEVYKGLLANQNCVGAKHSSLNRELEWQRIHLRNEMRPDFKVLTGNDLAIDMVMYGSDYLLGLSTFAPEAFALRDKMWEQRNPEFYELNDVLQYLGCFTFRDPVPAYKHSAAQFLKLGSWIETDLTYPNSPQRSNSDVEVLQQIHDRISSIMKNHSGR